MTVRLLPISIAVCVLGSLVGRPAIALNEGTHELINEHAARRSKLDEILKAYLGLRDGLDEPITGRPVVEWLRDGGSAEDTPLCRTARHFHDPLKPWEDAGLSTYHPFIVLPCGNTSFPSSLVWMQTHPQDAGTTLGGDWSWQLARQRYFEALAGPDPGKRAEKLADALRAIGQAMHLVVDASVPEHVRNDIHIVESALRRVGLRGYGTYEYWVSDQHGLRGSPEESRFMDRYLSSPTPVDPAVLTEGTGDSAVRIPVARLIDTDAYTGFDPNVTLGGPIGIAEFANANFFSEDTGRGEYRFPSLDALVPALHVTPTGPHVRSYYSKGAGDGLPVDTVLAECAFDQAAADDGVPLRTTVKCTDPNVWARVAEAMLPRAVGYAAALLDYFFRGQLEAQIEIDYAVDPPVHVLRVTNRTAGEFMAGEFALHYEASDGTRKRLRSWGPTTLAPGQTSEPLPLPAPPPDQAELGRYLVLFRGRLGEEPDAVSARWIGAGIYSVALWYDTFYPWDDGAVEFVPIATALPGGTILSLSADASHTLWAFYTGESGESRAGSATYVYRPLEAVPGDAATLRVIGQCSGGGGISPVTAELVELEPPRDLSALEAYIWSTRPAVRRTLYPFSALASRWSEAQTASVHLDGARFLGVRVLSQPVATPPPPPVPFPPLSTSYAECYAAIQVHVQP